MNGSLFLVGGLSFATGLGLLYLGIKDKVSADTTWGKYSGHVGAVALLLGIVLMATSTIL